VNEWLANFWKFVFEKYFGIFFVEKTQLTQISEIARKHLAFLTARKNEQSPREKKASVFFS